MGAVDPSGLSLQRLTIRLEGVGESQGWTALTLLWLEESLLEGEPIFQKEISHARSGVISPSL